MTRDVYTPGWKDAHGVVHIAGSHGYRRVYAECGEIIAESDDTSPSGIAPAYEVCVEPPTCLMCIGSAVDYLPWTATQLEGIAIINVNALKKLDLKL
jgi:hypothetical protein